MNDTELKGRGLLKGTGVIFIILSVLGVVLTAAAALSLLIDLKNLGISSSAGDVVRLSLAALYTLGAWRNKQTLQ